MLGTTSGAVPVIAVLTVYALVGASVGTDVDGAPVGAPLGTAEGALVGAALGSAEGDELGTAVGAVVGVVVEADVGVGVGAAVLTVYAVNASGVASVVETQLTLTTTPPVSWAARFEPITYDTSVCADISAAPIVMVRTFPTDTAVADGSLGLVTSTNVMRTLASAAKILSPKVHVTVLPIASAAVCFSDRTDDETVAPASRLLGTKSGAVPVIAVTGGFAYATKVVAQ